MKKCTICEKMVEDGVEKCPHCGHDFNFVYKKDEVAFKKRFEEQDNLRDTLGKSLVLWDCLIDALIFFVLMRISSSLNHKNDERFFLIMIFFSLIIFFSWNLLKKRVLNKNLFRKIYVIISMGLAVIVTDSIRWMSFKYALNVKVYLIEIIIAILIGLIAGIAIKQKTPLGFCLTISVFTGPALAKIITRFFLKDVGQDALNVIVALCFDCLDIIWMIVVGIIISDDVVAFIKRIQAMHANRYGSK